MSMELLWAINSVLLLVAGFFLKREYEQIKADLATKASKEDVAKLEKLICGLKNDLQKKTNLTDLSDLEGKMEEIEKEVKEKASVTVCKILHERLDKLAHTHGQSGQAGEMVVVR